MSWGLIVSFIGSNVWLFESLVYGFTFTMESGMLDALMFYNLLKYLDDQYLSLPREQYYFVKLLLHVSLIL